jgi:hypothetical protein
MLKVISFLFQVFLLALFAGFCWLIWWIVKQVRLRKEHILEEWQNMTEQGEGSKDEVFDIMVEALEAARPPSVYWKREVVHVGGPVFTKPYDSLTIWNSNLSPFRIYFLAFDYGTDLYTAWFLVYKPSIFRRIWHTFLALIKGMEGKIDPRDILNLAQLLELSAYTTVVHSSAKKAVQALTEKLNQDFSKVNTKSKGFLELW